MLWPVTDGLRITRVSGFTHPRQGYTLDWGAWFRQLARADQSAPSLSALNQARLYFDVRLIPIAAADLHPLARDLRDPGATLHPSYLQRFRSSHFFSILTDRWNPDAYSPMRERESARATEARAWYASITTDPVRLSNRIAAILRALDLDAQGEARIRTRHGSVRADILVQPTQGVPRDSIIELKAFSAENTRPSSIRDAVRATLRKYAILGGFLEA